MSYEFEQKLAEAKAQYEANAILPWSTLWGLELSVLNSHDFQHDDWSKVVKRFTDLQEDLKIIQYTQIEDGGNWWALSNAIGAMNTVIINMEKLTNE